MAPKSRADTHGVYRHQTNPHQGATPPKKNETPRNQTRVSWQMAVHAHQNMAELGVQMSMICETSF